MKNGAEFINTYFFYLNNNLKQKKISYKTKTHRKLSHLRLEPEKLWNFCSKKSWLIFCQTAALVYSDTHNLRNKTWIPLIIIILTYYSVAHNMWVASAFHYCLSVIVCSWCSKCTHMWAESNKQYNISPEDHSSHSDLTSDIIIIRLLLN